MGDRGRLRRNVLLPLLPAAGLAHAADVGAAPPVPIAPAPTLPKTASPGLAPAPGPSPSFPRPLLKPKPADALLVTDLTLTPPLATPGQTVHVKARVKNAGPAALAQIEWTATFEGQTRSGVVASLAAGATAVLEHDVPAGSVGQKTLVLTLDPNSKIESSLKDRLNNQARATLVVATGSASQWDTWARKSATRVPQLLAVVRPPACLEGTITGPSLVIHRIDPGTPNQVLVEQALAGDGVPQEVAKEWAAAFTDTFRAWAQAYRGTSATAFPAFAAFPGPQAPPVPATPATLGMYGTSGEAARAFTAADIEGRLRARLAARVNEAGAAAAVKNLAAAWAAQLTTWALTQEVSIQGQGPVPSFAPPYVPVGPVVGGSVVRSPGVCKHLP